MHASLREFNRRSPTFENTIAPEEPPPRISTSSLSTVKGFAVPNTPANELEEIAARFLPPPWKQPNAGSSEACQPLRRKGVVPVQRDSSNFVPALAYVPPPAAWVQP
jgi:hypothetical protein